MVQRRPVLWWFVPLMACSSDPLGIEAPGLGTDYVVYGTAQAGRALEPGSLVIANAAGFSNVEPDSIGGGKIDMVYAGLAAADLPVNLSPAQLVFVSDRDEKARPLPPLLSAHVLEEPSDSANPAPLVPVEVTGASRDLLADRIGRFEAMINDLRVQNPCRDPTTPFVVTTPRIPADAIYTMRTLSTGQVLLGLSVTSTAVFGVVEPSRTEVTLVPVNTGTVALVERGETAIVRFLTDTEVDSPLGRVPDGLTIEIVGGFGSVGLALRYQADRQRYLDITPRLPNAFPRSLFGIAELDLSDGPAWCVHGGVQGADRRAAIWCQRNGGQAWIVVGDFPRSFGITRIAIPRSGVPLAFDLAGGTYQLENERWVARSSSAINSGCDPLCASFSTTALAVGGGDVLGVLAGSKAQLLTVAQNGEAQPVSGLTAALFSDERIDAVEPLRYSAAEVAPDGAIYVASTRPDLFRIAPDRETVERICLPKDVRDTPIASIEASPDGRLLLGFAPALLTFGRWDDL